MTSNVAASRFEACSSGENMRKFLCSMFMLVTSRRNSPSFRVASPSVVPGFFTSTA